MRADAPPILIAACGNVDAGDDAFGPAVAAALREMDLPMVEVVDLDIRPAALLDHLDLRLALIVVDAVKSPHDGPGRLVDVDWFHPRRPALVNDDPMSTHGISIGAQLDLAGRLGMLPQRARLVGGTLNDAEVGQPMSPAMRELVRDAASYIHRLCEQWLSQIREPTHA